MTKQLTIVFASILLCANSINVFAQESDLTLLSTLSGGDSSYATSINNFGHIVGWSDINSPNHAGVNQTGFRATLWEALGNNTYQLKQLEELTQNGSNSRAFTINNNASLEETAIGGWSMTAAGEQVPTFWARNTVDRPDSLDGAVGSGSINAINDLSISVGSTINQENVLQSTIWRTNIGVTPFVADPLGDLSNGSDDHATVRSDALSATVIGGITIATGYSELANGNSQAVTWRADSTGFTALNDLGGLESVASDINSNGEIIGYGNTAGDNALQPIFWQDNGGTLTPTQLDTITGTSSGQALAINANSEIVGFSSDVNDQFATLWRNGTAIDLNDHIAQNIKDDGWVLLEATDINDSGLITGNAINTNTGLNRGFAMTAVVTSAVSPVPEPKQYALFIVGLAVLLRKKMFS